MQKRAEKRSRWLLTALIASTFALRAATPAGYMPGSLADGTLFVLCPGSSPALAHFLETRAATTHHAHDAEGGSAAAPWSQCEFAAAAFAAIAPVPAAALPASMESESPGTSPVESVPPAPILTRHARGPPPVAT
ncbi:MAG: hypothetical protein R3176_12010 [Woeseiaceae bacterium]|nr:hypothetical protein [Woeseiaceae bacterium]